MRKSFLRFPLLILVFFLIGYGYYFYIENYSGDGKKTAEEALPTDHDYTWIEGPKSDNEVRYFFLADSHYFGTGVVTKNKKGWSSGHGAFSEIPQPLVENNIQNAYSDEKIIFGIIKNTQDITIKVNDKPADLLPLDKLDSKVIKEYDVKNCSFWYVNLKDLDEKESFHIQVIGEGDKIINELSI